MGQRFLWLLPIVVLCVICVPARAAQPANALDRAVEALNDWNTPAIERANAVSAIRGAGNAARAHIYKLLQSTNWMARVDGLTLASQTGMQGLSDAVIAASRDKNWAVRAHAATLAADVPAEYRAGMEPAIKTLLTDPIGNVRLAAYKTLVTWRPDDTYISGALSDPDTEVSYWAAQQYMSRAQVRALTPEARIRLTESIIAKLRSTQWREADSRSIATLFALGATAHEALYDAIINAPPNVRAQAVSTIGSRAGKAAADLLLLLMQAPDPNLQRTAISVLQGICDKSHGPRLLETMKTATDPQVRQYALQALGRIQYKEALPHVLKLLEQRDRSVMSAALGTIAAMGDKTTVPRLLELYEMEPEGYTRSQWINPIAQLLKHEAADFLRAAARDDHQAVRQAAVYAVRSFLKEEDQADILMRVVQDEDSDYVRYTAISHLSQEQVERALDALIEALREGGQQSRRAAASRLGQSKSLRAVQALIDAFAQEDTPDIRDTVIAALGNVRDQRAIPILKKALISNDPHLRSAALRALSNFPDVVSPGLLVGLIQKEQDDVVLNACIQIINARGLVLPECLPQFARMTKSPDNGLRYGVLSCISRIESVPAVQLLCRLIQEDADPSVRALAVNALVAHIASRKITPHSIQKALLGALETTDDSARQRIVSALAELRDPALAPVFLQVLKRDTADTVRRQAALALRQVARKEIVPEIIEAAKAEENPTNMVILVELLGDIADRQALPFLKDCLRSSDAAVQAAALRAGGAFKDASLIPFYVDRFKESTSSEVRLNSLRALKGTGDRRALEAVTAAVADDDPLIRQAALDILTEFRDAKVAALLIDRVTSDENAIEPTEPIRRLLGEVRPRSAAPTVVAAARRASDPARLRGFCSVMGALRDRRTVPFLADLIRKNAAPDVMETALEALRRVGTRQDAALCLHVAQTTAGRLSREAVVAAKELGAAEEVATLAAARFGTGTEIERRFYASLLATSEPKNHRVLLQRTFAAPDDTPLLISVCSALRTTSPENVAPLEAIALGDIQPGVAAEAIGALMRAGIPSARAALVRILLSSRPAAVRAAALAAYARIVGWPEAREALLRCLSSPEPELRIAGLRAFSATQGSDPEITQQVISWARQDADGAARIEAIRALGVAYGSKDAEQTLLALLHSQEREVETEDTIRSLGQLRAAAAVPALADLVGSAQLPVRIVALEALGQIGTEPARAAIEEAFEQENIDRVRSAAAVALGRTGDHRYVDRLVRALQSAPGLDVRRACAAALGELGGSSARTALVEALRDDSGAVRESGVRALAAMHARTAVNEIRKLLDDTDADVASAARECLVRLQEQRGQ